MQSHVHIHFNSFIQRLEAMNTSSGQKILVSKHHPPIKETRAWAGKIQSAWNFLEGSAQSMMGNMPRGHMSQLDGALTGQIWNSLSVKINNDSISS